jgi:hypothetical protein
VAYVLTPFNCFTWGSNYGTIQDPQTAEATTRSAVPAYPKAETSKTAAAAADPINAITTLILEDMGQILFNA